MEMWKILTRVCSCAEMPAIAVPLGSAQQRMGFGETWERHICTGLWELSLQKSQKSPSIFISVGGTVSFHVDLLVTMVPGTVSSRPENFIVRCYTNVCELWIAPFLHRNCCIKICHLGCWTLVCLLPQVAHLFVPLLKSHPWVASPCDTMEETWVFNLKRLMNELKISTVSNPRGCKLIVHSQLTVS